MLVGRRFSEQLLLNAKNAKIPERRKDVRHGLPQTAIWYTVELSSFLTPYWQITRHYPLLRVVFYWGTCSLFYYYPIPDSYTVHKGRRTTVTTTPCCQSATSCCPHPLYRPHRHWGQVTRPQATLSASHVPQFYLPASHDKDSSPPAFSAYLPACTALSRRPLVGLLRGCTVAQPRDDHSPAYVRSYWIQKRLGTFPNRCVIASVLCIIAQLEHMPDIAHCHSPLLPAPTCSNDNNK